MVYKIKSPRFQAILNVEYEDDHFLWCVPPNLVGEESTLANVVSDVETMNFGHVVEAGHMFSLLRVKG